MNAFCIRTLVCSDCNTTFHRTCSGLSLDAASTGHWVCLDALSMLHLHPHPPNLLQAALTLSRNTACVFKHYSTRIVALTLTK